MSLHVCVVFDQGCWVFIQYNLLKGCCEWILIQSWTQVIHYSLLGLTWHTRLRIGISHLFISRIVVHGRCYISHSFYFSVIFYFPVIFFAIVYWLIFCFLFFLSCLSIVFVVSIMVLLHHIIVYYINKLHYIRLL